MEMLRNIRDTELQMQRKYERIMRLKSALEYTAPVAKEGGGAAGSKDPLGDKYARLDELQREYMAMFSDYEVAVDAAELLLTPLNETDREILRLRYYDALPWREVAERMNYSERQCKRRGKLAISKVG